MGYKKFKHLSDWIMVEHCAVRILEGGDINNISDRVAFIEKTPRVKIYSTNHAIEPHIHDVLVDVNEGNERGGTTTPDNIMGNRCIWMYGDKGSDEYGEDMNSRLWCDNLLKAMGWEVISDETPY